MDFVLQRVHAGFGFSLVHSTRYSYEIPSILWKYRVWEKSCLRGRLVARHDFSQLYFASHCFSDGGEYISSHLGCLLYRRISSVLMPPFGIYGELLKSLCIGNSYTQVTRVFSGIWQNRDIRHLCMHTRAWLLGDWRRNSTKLNRVLFCDWHHTVWTLPLHYEHGLRKAWMIHIPVPDHRVVETCGILRPSQFLRYWSGRQSLFRRVRAWRHCVARWKLRCPFYSAVHWTLTSIRI